MKRPLSRLLFSLLLTGSLLTTTILPRSPFPAQAQTSHLFYTFYGQQIPLTLQSNVIAVAFRETVGTRGSDLPLYLQLQQDLQERSSRSGNRVQTTQASPEIEVQPLGDRFALVTLPDTGFVSSQFDQRIRQQPYVESTLPVLAVQNTAVSTASDAESPTFVLPNEIVVSFEADLSPSQTQVLLNRYGLELIRPLRFTQNRYLVRSKTEQGTEILHLANRLNGVTGIQSATPNFIQSLAQGVQRQGLEDATLATIPDASAQLDQRLAALPQLEAVFRSRLLPLAWHLNSTPRRGTGLPRTDVHATEAWDISNGGAGTVVAVIDSLIQWDHPDLQPSLYRATSQADLLPGEVHGWDFTSDRATCPADQADSCIVGDPDTRISDEELALLRPHFQNSFQLANPELLQEYESLAANLASYYPDLSTSEIATAIRNIIRSDIAAEFHGTWSAGVIAAQPQQQQGAIGVAPNAEILPVRVFGLGGETTSARLIEAIGYAAERDVDVINMSLGGLLPDQELADQVFRVLDANPDLAIVASAGNDSVDGVAFPAAIPGVISVGATNLEGRRTFYSSYGARLDVVAPGGETAMALSGGILTTGGTWVEGFWSGMTIPDYAWSVSLDAQGQYVQVQGTSFSAPIVSGVAALMKGVNPDLNRDRLAQILRETASYDGLQLSQADRNRYRLQSQTGMTLMQDRLSGIFPFPVPVSAEQYFYGYGLVNAEAAVRAAKR